MVTEYLETIVSNILPFDLRGDNKTYIFGLDGKNGEKCCNNPRPFQFIRIYRGNGRVYEMRRCDSCGRNIYVPEKENEHSAA